MVLDKTESNHVDEKENTVVNLTASGTPTIVSDDFDKARTEAEGHECKQLFIEGLSLKVHDDDGQRFPGGTVEGLANAFGNVDFQGEVMKRGAFKRTIQAFKASKKGLPLMDNHRIFGGTDAVIGSIIELKETQQGLFFKAFFSSVDAAQAVRTKIREGILNSLSIGFSIIKKNLRKDGILELLEVKLREISIVVFPANELALVSDVKSAIRRIEACADLEREFDEPMASKRWRDYCGDGITMAAWPEEIWAKYAGAFAFVDGKAATQAGAFRCLVLDVIGEVPVIVYSAVKAALDSVGSNEFLKDLEAKFDVSTGKSQSDENAKAAGASDDNSEGDKDDASNAPEMPHIKLDTLRAELKALQRRKTMREMRALLKRHTS